MGVESTFFSWAEGEAVHYSTSRTTLLAVLINTWKETCTHEKETNKSYIEEQLLVLNSDVVGLSQFGFQYLGKIGQLTSYLVQRAAKVVFCYCLWTPFHFHVDLYDTSN